MKIALLIWFLGDWNKIKLTLNSILKQTHLDKIEIILIDDSEKQIDIIKLISNLQITQFFNFKIISNTRNQGYSISWNIAKNYTNCEYVWFLREGIEFEPNAFKNIFTSLSHNKNIDIIQLKIEFQNYNKDNLDNLLPYDKVLDLSENKEILAYVYQHIYTKIFKLSIIQKYCIEFKAHQNYDILFLYKFLVHAKTFINLDNILIKVKSFYFESTTLDLVRQWPHIINYYKIFGVYKIYEEEINYAFIKYISFTYVNFIIFLDNKVLMKKSYEWINKRLHKKISYFAKNRYLDYNQNDSFANYAKQFKNYWKDTTRILLR